MIINYAVSITGSVKTGAYAIKGNINSTSFTLTGKLICGAGSSETSTYEGPYAVTPTRNTQTLPTANKKAITNVVVNPIPPEYGLITWNGSYLRVS